MFEMVCFVIFVGKKALIFKTALFYNFKNEIYSLIVEWIKITVQAYSGM